MLVWMRVYVCVFVVNFASFCSAIIQKYKIILHNWKYET